MRISNCFYTTNPLSILLFSGLILACFSLHAETVDITSQKTLRPSEVLGLAQNYSINHPDTIGVFISLAPDTNIPPEKMGEAISILFKRQGIDTYITSYDGIRGISNITFFIRGKSYPGYTFDRLEKGIVNIAKIHKAEAKLAKLRKDMEGLLETQTELEDAFGNSKN